MLVLPSAIKVTFNKTKSRVFSTACKALLIWTLPTPETYYSPRENFCACYLPCWGSLGTPCHVASHLCFTHSIPLLGMLCLIVTPSCPAGLRAGITFSGNTSGPPQLGLAVPSWSSLGTSGWPLSEPYDLGQRIWPLSVSSSVKYSDSFNFTELSW